MKHVHHLTKMLPQEANEFQFTVCQLSRLASDLLTEKGGESPMLNWINGKCDLPQGPTP